MLMSIFDKGVTAVSVFSITYFIKVILAHILENIGFNKYFNEISALIDLYN